MHVRITQIGGKLPNLALMTISAYHRKRGDEIYFIRDVKRETCSNQSTAECMEASRNLCTMHQRRRPFGCLLFFHQVSQR
jgi:hypothetical protein